MRVTAVFQKGAGQLQTCPGYWNGSMPILLLLRHVCQLVLEGIIGKQKSRPDRSGFGDWVKASASRAGASWSSVTNLDPRSPAASAVSSWLHTAAMTWPMSASGSSTPRHAIWRRRWTSLN